MWANLEDSGESGLGPLSAGRYDILLSAVWLLADEKGRGLGGRGGSRLDKPSEESPDSTGQVTGKIPAGETSGKCHREQTADGLR